MSRSKSSKGNFSCPLLIRHLTNLPRRIKDLQKLETNNATAASFATKRQDVLVIQQLGINIRTQNQQIAGEIKSPAIAGLNTVQGAQTTEMRQVMGLTGNEKTDAAVLQTLVKEVEDGTKQNEANLAAAQGQCKK